MSTLSEIEAAADALPSEQKEELVRFLSSRRYASGTSGPRARAVRRGDDLLLEAPAGAPPMTPDNIKRMLEDWP